MFRFAYDRHETNGIPEYIIPLLKPNGCLGKAVSRKAFQQLRLTCRRLSSLLQQQQGGSSLSSRLLPAAWAKPPAAKDGAAERARSATVVSPPTSPTPSTACLEERVSLLLCRRLHSPRKPLGCAAIEMQLGLHCGESDIETRPVPTDPAKAGAGTYLPEQRWWTCGPWTRNLCICSLFCQHGLLSKSRCPVQRGESSSCNFHNASAASFKLQISVGSAARRTRKL